MIHSLTTIKVPSLPSLNLGIFLRLEGAVWYNRVIVVEYSVEIEIGLVSTMSSQHDIDSYYNKALELVKDAANVSINQTKTLQLNEMSF